MYKGVLSQVFRINRRKKQKPLVYDDTKTSDMRRFLLPVKSHKSPGAEHGLLAPEQLAGR